MRDPAKAADLTLTMPTQFVPPVFLRRPRVARVIQEAAWQQRGIWLWEFVFVFGRNTAVHPWGGG